MSEYGSGVTLVQAFNYDKERLLKALEGQLICGETEHGFKYEDATEEECRDFIISVFDNAVYHALKGYQSGRVLEKVMYSNGLDYTSGQIFKDYMHYLSEDEATQIKGEQYNYGDPDNKGDEFDE
jgi:hypothetical protein